MTRHVVAAIGCLLLAGCGAYRGVGPEAPPTPPAHGFDVTATEKDRAITMRVGQTLELVLHGGTAASWQQVRSSDGAILRPIPDPAAAAAKGVTLAAFSADAPGQATVTAVGIPVCPTGQACPMYAILYSLSVTVTR